MKPLYEKILPRPDHSFAAATLEGAVIDCEYHVHPELELICINSSFGGRIINDDISQFDTGSVNLIGSLVPHHYYNSPSDSKGEKWASVTVIQFLKDFAGKDFLELPEMEKISQLFQDAQYGLDFPTAEKEKIHIMARKVISATGVKRITLLVDLLGTLSEMPYRKISGHRLSFMDEGENERINRILRLIHSRIGQGRSLSLKEAAFNIGMGAEGFSRYFVRSTGKNFIDYMVELKLGKATNLLIHSEDQIAEISLASGFGNLSNFNRHFLKVKGMTPGEYRRKFRHAAK